MTIWIKRILQFRWLILASMLTVTMFTASQLPKLEIEISMQSLSLESDPDRAFLTDTQSTFGSQNATAVYLSGDRLLEPQVLEAILASISQLESSPHVLRTESLFSALHIYANDGDFVVEPLIPEIPQTKAQTQQIIDNSLKNPFTRQNLLSTDARSMAIYVYITDTDLSGKTSADITAHIEHSIAPLRAHLDAVFQIGDHYLRDSVNRSIRSDQDKILLLAGTILIVALFFTLHKFAAVLAPLLTSGLSIVWTLGWMAHFGIPLTVMTAIVPVLLLIIGSTEDIHLISEYLHGAKQGYSRQRALIYMAKRVGLAILLTFATSFIGFIAIAATPVGVVQEFGTVTAVALAINFLITYTLIPIYLYYAGKHCMVADTKTLQQTNRRRSSFKRAVVATVIHSRWLVVVVVLIATIFFINGARQLQVNNSLLDYFPDDDPVKVRSQVLSDNLAGIEIASIVVDGHIQGAFEKVHYLEQIKAIQDFISQHPDLDLSISIVDYLSLLYSGLNDTGDIELPEEDDVIETLLAIASPDSLVPLITEDNSKANIIVRHNLSSSRDLRHALDDIERFIAHSVDSDLDVRIIGDSILNNNAVDFIAKGQIESLLLVILAIFAVVSVLFGGLKAGFVALIPNLFPLVVLFGVMGYLGISLDTGTAMIAAIALGVSIDHTMHFLLRYNNMLQLDGDPQRALYRTIAFELTPVTAATLALASGLGALMLASFNPIIYFGFLSALVMLLAYFANFFITPILIRHINMSSLWDFLSVPIRKELVAASPLFKDMSNGQVRRTIKSGEIRSYETGDTILHQHTDDRSLFVLISGCVELSSFCQSRTPRIESTVGQTFCVIDALGNRTGCTQVRALEPVTVLKLNWQQIEKTAKQHPSIGHLLYRNLASLIVSKT